MEYKMLPTLSQPNPPDGDTIRPHGVGRIIPVDGVMSLYSNTDMPQSHQSLCKEINEHYIACPKGSPDYFFEMSIDFELTTKETRAKQYVIIGKIVSAFMNSCGGVLTLTSIRSSSSSSLDTWRNDLQTHLSFIPQWFFTNMGIIMSIVDETTNNIPQKKIVMCVKRSSCNITYNTHMYVRGPDAATRQANIDTVLNVIATQTQISGQTLTSASLPVVPSELHSGKQLDRLENQWVEYKHWETATTADALMERLKDPRTAKTIFAMPNNIRVGHIIIGVSDDLQVKGQVLSLQDQRQIMKNFAEWMEIDEKGNARIWRNGRHKLKKGVDWNLQFLPVDGSHELVLLLISIAPCAGGMFEQLPECYIITDAGKVAMLTLQEWLQRISIGTPSSLLSDLISVDIASSAARVHPNAPKLPITPHDHCPSTQSGVTVGALVSRDVSSSSSTSPEQPKAVMAPAKYQQISWTEGTDWAKLIEEPESDDSLMPEPFPSSLFQLSDEMNLSTSVKKLCEKIPQSATEIQCLLQDLGQDLENIPSCVIAFPTWADSFDHDSSITPPAGHIIDLLILMEDNVQMVMAFETMESSELYEAQRNFAFELCRILKKKIMLQLQTNTNNTAYNVFMKPVLYDANKEQYDNLTSTQTNTPTLECICCNMSTTSGISLGEIQSSITSILITRHVWVKDRVGRDMSYVLTKRQIEGVLTCCSQKMSIIEASPGCGKSIIALYICQRYAKHGKVLYMSPRKGFAYIVRQQKIANVRVVRTDAEMTEAIDHIYEERYTTVVFDDIQALECTEKTLSKFLEIVKIKSPSATKRLLLLMDSEYQNFYGYNTCAILQQIVVKLCNGKTMPKCNIIRLPTNLRNCRKVFAFLKAQILKEEYELDEINCGNPQVGDNVFLRVVVNPWEDSADNGLIQLVQDLICPGNENDYEETDVILMVDDTMKERSSKLREIFSKHSGIDVNKASDIPHIGVAIDAVDEFVGMEAPVSIVVLDDSGNERSHENMAYLLFTASRGVVRSEIVFTKPFGEQDARLLGIDNLTRAEKFVGSFLMYKVDKVRDTEAEDSQGQMAVVQHKQTAKELLDLIDVGSPIDKVYHCVVTIVRQVECIRRERPDEVLDELGAIYLPSLITLLTQDPRWLNEKVLMLAWWVCYRMVCADTAVFNVTANPGTCVSSGLVEVAFSHLTIYTHRDVLRHILGVLTDIALRFSHVMLNTDYIDTLFWLLDHSDKAIRYRSCEVLVRLLHHGPRHAPGINRSEVTNTIMAAIATWDLNETLWWRPPTLEWAVEYLSSPEAPAQYLTAWVVGNLVRNNPGTYCPMVASHIGVSYLQDFAQHPDRCQQARLVISQVLDSCRDHAHSNAPP